MSSRCCLCVAAVSILSFFAFLTSVSGQTTYPPLIISQLNSKQKIFEGGDSFQLPCVAESAPQATYTWTRNDLDFVPAGSDDKIVQQQGEGTLTFNFPEKQHEGFYKCFATNDFGTAVSGTVQLIFAVLNEFHSLNYPLVTKTAGESMRMICQRPSSFPEADIIWTMRTATAETNIDYNDRVTIDPDGGLNFAFVQPSDTAAYRCEAYNRILRKTTRSGPQPLNVQGDLSETRIGPTPNWTPRTSESFIRGREARIKCIFSGKPTPGVLWRRSDGRDLSVRAQVRSFGLELYFETIEYEDAGAYECDGYNKAKSVPYKSTVNVQVQGHMRWIREPMSVTKGENETVTFVCQGEGLPRPDLPKWSINAQEFRESTANHVIGDEYGPSTTLTIKNLVKERDTMAIQCNITNHLIGSWVYSSFYLNVQSEPPSIERFDDGPHKWAAGQNQKLQCKVFGAPTPVISWKKDGQSLTGGRFVTNDDGTLDILNVGITDAGNYECVASNVKGEAAKSADVIVRRRTQIRSAPFDLTVTAGTQAKFVCTGLTDPDESQNLKITWLKDGSPMNYFENNRVYMNAQDNSLQIAGPQSLDSGLYTCRASNGIDSAEASATLRVQDRPDRPPIVSVEDCMTSTGSAKVKWSPGTNNNAPLTNFIIQYQTHLDESIWYTAFDYIEPKVTEQVVDLPANNRYKFRVLAQNKIGVSDPSNPSSTSCNVDPARPKINPRGVRTLDEGQTKLVITWQPISQVDFGGSSFVYIVKYRQSGQNKCGNNDYCTERRVAKEGTSGRPGESNIIEYKVEVLDQQVYTKYDINVTTENNVGASSARSSFVIGYSGEGNPKQVVSGFRLVEKEGVPMVFSDNATFTWNKVEESDVESQGFFRGYMIQYNKQIVENTDEHFDTRSIYVVLRDVKKEGLAMKNRSLVENELGAVENEDDGTVTVTLTHLPPNSELSFTISVINKRRYGTAAPLGGLLVTTLEGAPGPIQQLSIQENGPTHVRLAWHRPLEPNGRLTRYMIGYKLLDGLQLGPMQYPDRQYVSEPSDPDQTVISAKVTGLKPLQMYRFYVWAYTNAGQGSEYFIDDSTVAAGYPNAPTINVQRLDNSTLNVSWVPSPIGVPANVFYVQYKQDSAIDQWQRTGWETDNNWIMVDGFADGWKYDIRVVASNGGIYETGSETESVFPTATSRTAAEATMVFSSAWFVGLLVALILVAAFFALVCLIQQNQGGRYTGQFAVEETERLRPYEDSAFDEKPPLRSELGEPTPSERYAPSHFSDRYPPQPSERGGITPSEKNSERWVGSQPPPHDEYMQDDPNKYGEEGSFIGQYRENKELPHFRPRTQQQPESYRPSQPQPRPRGPPSESAYSSSGPVPQPRDGNQPSQPQYRPPPRQPRSAQQPPNDSYNDYRPQNRTAAAADYTPNTRYRPVTTPHEPENEANDTVV